MIGQHISHFYILRQLGSGGMGVVYEAQDTRLPRSVAIKFLKPTLSADAHALKRFKREAQLASSLNHPNICTILDVEEGEGQAFIAMELLHGSSLKDRLAAGALRLDEILAIGVQVADALAAAHDEGIIHRDIKPGNVFLTESGLVKLLDFGLAKHFPTNDGNAQATDNLTAAGAVAGTLLYMSPEQLDVDAPVDYRCDLFALGALLYEMATGTRPFDNSLGDGLVSAIRFQPHVPLRQLSPECPAELERIIDRLLAKRPDDRYQSARTLRNDLEALDATPKEPKRWATPPRRHAPRSEGPPAALRTALADRYAVGAEVGRGGMATVYAAEDLRHSRRVALKVLDPQLGAMLGAERFLAEIQVTAGLQHPNLVPLFDSGEAEGMLYYVMPLVEGASLRARLEREPQLPVDEAVRIVSVIAGALDYAHRHGVVHRDLKPENILLHDGQPLVADFGIALAVARAGGSNLTATGMSLGTPRYMSPEQAAADANVDGRSDIYSLACVLYELLVGDPPFTGSSAQAIIAKVISEVPSSVRIVRPTIPAHIDAALTRALAKVPADRYATAREFADALVSTSTAELTGSRAPATRWRRTTRVVLGAAAIIGVAIAVWPGSREPEAPSWFVYDNLIDQSLGSTVTITPDGRALVYTGTVAAGRPFMLRPVGQLAARAIAGTEGASMPYVSPSGRRLAFISGGIKTASIDGGGAADLLDRRSLNPLRFLRDQPAWRYGNGAWVGDSAIVLDAGGNTWGLWKHAPGGGKAVALTRPDSARGGYKHASPLLLPDGRAVVFTAGNCSGPRLVAGELAIASLTTGTESFSPFVLLGVPARRAIAFVDGWLLYIRADGGGIMAVQLDVERRRISGTPVSVLVDDKGNLESASLADNGTLLYVRRPQANSPVLVDTSGGVHLVLAGVDKSFMYPRISPDGKRFAVQVTAWCGEDLWVYDIASRTPTQLTTTGKALHPTWTPDGHHIVFMRGGFAGLASQPVDGGAEAETFQGTEGAFAPTVTPDGHSALYQRNTDGSIWSAPLRGAGTLRKVLDDSVTRYTMPALSPDGRWLAYVSNATGRDEVYARPYPGPGPAVQISDSGGKEPAWSPRDGHRIYYMKKGALMAVGVRVSTRVLAITSSKQLFKGEYDGGMPHRDYDVAPDGKGFLMIAQARRPEAVVGLHWLPELRAQLARAGR